MFKTSNVTKLTAVTLNFGIEGYLGQFRPKPEALAECKMAIVTKQTEKHPLLRTLLIFFSINVSTV